MKIIYLVLCLYLLVAPFTSRTPNFKSALVVKIIPFIAGLFFTAYFMFAFGYITINF